MNFANNDKEQLVFESAGMFEINVNLPEENLKVNPENKINVTLNSFSNDSNFNTYDLENATNVWIETGKDTMNESSKEDALAKLPKLPIAPKLTTYTAFQIIDVSNEENGLAEYENFWLQPIESKKVIGISEDIKVKDLKDGKYEITFYFLQRGKELSSTKVICYLASNTDTDYLKALNSYTNKFAKIIKEDKDKRDKIEREWAIYHKQFTEYKLFFAKNEIEKTKGSQKIIRSLEVNNFGFVNIDRPIDFPQGANINPVYVDENNNKITLKEIVLVETGRVLYTDTRMN